MSKAHPLPPHVQLCPCGECLTTADIAVCWYRAGLSVIPVRSGGSKATAVYWDPWLECLSEEKIRGHWQAHPDHNLGFILGEDLIVFDADTPESLANLYLIEKNFDIVPLLINKTRNGEHRFFKRPSNVFAKSDGHDSEKHPERIDVKTGRALVVLPPSPNKFVMLCEAEMANNLSEATQDFVDAVFRLNERPEPRPPVPCPIVRNTQVPADLNKLQQLVDLIDPDSGYDDWFSVGAAIHTETQGSNDGFEIFDEWSSQGLKYSGREKLRYQWQQFRSDIKNPKTIGTLIHIAREQGADVASVVDGDEQFKVCETEVVAPSEPLELPSYKGPASSLPGSNSFINPLSRFSITGQSAELEKRADEEKAVLGQLALSGQITLFYAPPNSGKTLITIKLIVDAIKQGLVNPKDINYFNLDDSSKGLHQKLEIAEEYGFEMMTDGYNDFRAKELPGFLTQMIDDNQAQGRVLIIDTLKKIVDLMHKKQSSDISNIFRRFVLKAGTVICLAHTNKRRGEDGKLIYAGTSDFVDDADCAYTLDVIESSAAPTLKVVEFSNIKHRGNVVDRVAYCYSRERDIPYAELVLSVQPYDQSKLDKLKMAEQMKSDAEIISAVKTCIRDGINTKMNLAVEVSSRAGVSRKIAIRSIEQYTGDDPSRHHWNFTVKERGKQIFFTL